MKNSWIPLAISLVCVSTSATAQTPRQFILEFAEKAKQEAPSFDGFDAQRGAKFFNEPHGHDWSCTSCHTIDPTAPGKHVVTGKSIQPLAPSANMERFTNPAKVEKWFKRNCQDVLKRECTPQEKGDVLTYLLSLAR